MNSFNIKETSNQNLVVTSSIAENLEEKFDGPRWSELPSLVLENIYSFLNRRDQSSMSLVCRNWHDDFSAPSLWRYMEFRFPDFESGTELCPDVNCARIFGAMFHHVEIIFNMEHSPFFPMPADIVLKQLKFFMEAVTLRSQLLSLSFKNMFWYLREVDGSVSADVYQAIFNLIRSQRRLLSVDLHFCMFKRDQTAEILNAIVENNSKTLKYLHLFTTDLKGPSDESTDISLEDGLNFRTLMNLEILEIDYTQIVEKMLMSFYEYRNKVDMTEVKGCLKEIKLLCYSDVVDSCLRIHPLVWKYLANIFPDLTINLTFAFSHNSMRLSTIIVPDMPLTVLNFSLQFKCFPAMEFGTLLRHITSCGINKYLEVLSVFWLDISLNFAPDLISFTNVSPGLKRLELEIGSPVDALDTVFKSWLENRPPSLSFVKIVIAYADTAEEKKNYQNLHGFYAPLLQSLGMKLLLQVPNTKN